MVDSQAANTTLREKVESLSRQHGEPTWLKEKRLNSYESYLQSPMPTVRDEDWRKTDIANLDLSKLVTVESIEKKTDTEPKAITALKETIECAGVFAEDFAARERYTSLESALAAKGVVFTSLVDAFSNHHAVLEKTLSKEVFKKAESRVADDKFSLMNKAMFNGGYFLYVPKNVTVEVPFVAVTTLPTLGTVAQDYGQAVFPRVIVIAEENANLSLISMTNSQKAGHTEGSLTLANALVEIYVSAGARVSVAEVVEMEANAPVFAINRVRAYLAQDARIDFNTAGLGGKQIKSDIETLLLAPGAESAVNGIVLGDAKERFAYNTIVDHSAPDTTSNINFRVALQDESVSIYQGIVKVDKIAQRTNAYQSNKNLLLGTEARADSIPKLEILADDVKCSHGATVGPVDKEQLFYLMCRGLSLPSAEELIVTGFFKQILDLNTIAGVSDYVESLVSEKIHR